MRHSDATRAVARATFFFGALPETMFDDVYAQSRLVSFDANETLFIQGTPADAVFAVIEGMVKLTVERKDGQEIVVETFHAGTSFAEALAFGNEHYPVSAIALVPSRILVPPARFCRPP